MTDSETGAGVARAPTEYFYQGGVTGPVVGIFYQEVITVVPLCGSETLVLQPSTMKALDGFRVEATL